MNGVQRKTVGFAVLNLVQGALVGVIPFVAASREPWVNMLLWVAGAAMILSAPLLVFAGKLGRMVAAGACLFFWATGLLFTLLIVFSSSYLYGIYGRHGVSVATIGFVLAALVLVTFWLLPLHELSYLRRLRGTK